MHLEKWFYAVPAGPERHSRDFLTIGGGWINAWGVPNELRSGELGAPYLTIGVGEGIKLLVLFVPGPCAPVGLGEGITCITVCARAEMR